MNAAIVGVLCSGLTILVRAIIDLSVERYKKAQAVKEARDDLENDLRKQVFLWREHAYAVRFVALKLGMSVGDLPALPKED